MWLNLETIQATDVASTHYQKDNQSVGQSVSQSVNQSINQSINQSESCHLYKVTYKWLTKKNYYDLLNSALLMILKLNDV